MPARTKSFSCIAVTATATASSILSVVCLSYCLFARSRSPLLGYCSSLVFVFLFHFFIFSILFFYSSSHSFPFSGFAGADASADADAAVCFLFKDEPP